MTDQTEAPQPRENVPEDPDWVSGEGGPQFSQSGMSPGGSEMENWKKPPSDTQGPDDPDTVKEQGERLGDRLGNT